MRAKKQLGQHFLTSTAAVAKIIAAGEIEKGEEILEIGPGKGVLTAALLQKGAFVTAVEKDTDLMIHLEERFRPEGSSNSIHIIGGDALEFDPCSHFKGKPYKLIANIPYYITGELVRKFLETKCQPSRIVFLVQKEVAVRIVAKDKKESLLSLSVKAYGTPKLIDTVKAGSFSPPPNVDSAILSITNISKKTFENKDENKFFSLLHAGFAHKRKMLLSNLVGARINTREKLEDIFKKLDISAKIRSEDLSLQQWLKLYEEIA